VLREESPSIVGHFRAKPRAAFAPTPISGALDLLAIFFLGAGKKKLLREKNSSLIIRAK